MAGTRKRVMRSFVHSSAGRVVGLVVALTTLAGCQRWTTVESPVASTVERNQPDRVRLTTANGRQLEWDNPSVAGDSLVGSIGGEGQPAVAIADIRRLEFRQTNVGLTVLSLSGAAAIALAVILATNPGEEDN